MGSDEEHEFVIGQQMADAVAREEAHRTAWAGSASPLSGIRYESSNGEGDLLRLRDAPADPRVEAFLDDVAAMTSDQVVEVRGALTTDDFYTLITFARRSIVRALRDGSPRLISQATTAVVVIDPERVDPRDVSWVIALTAWGVQRLVIPRVDVLRDALHVGTPSAIEALNRFLDASIDLADWGFMEVATASGPGLAERESATYSPTSNLLGAAFVIADEVATDRYEPASLTVASTLPKVWFRNPDEARLVDALAGVRATISIRSQPLPTEHSNPSSQMLLVFLLECANREDAAWLAAAAEGAVGKSHLGVAARRGVFVATLIARSVVVGTASIETAESVSRFRSALENALSTLSSDVPPANPPRDARRRWWRRGSG